MDELKEMQIQLNSLKESLNKSNIANERLLKKVISHKMSSLNRIVWIQCITFPFILLFLLGFCLAFDINLWIVRTFAIASLIDIAFDFRTIRVSTKQLTTRTMLEIRQKLIRQKKERFIQNCIAIPLVIAWMLWFFSELVNKFSDLQDIKIIISVFLVCIGISAVLLVLLFIRKIERNANSMIAEIDENKTKK